MDIFIASIVESIFMTSCYTLIIYVIAKLAYKFSNGNYGLQ